MPDDKNTFFQFKKQYLEIRKYLTMVVFTILSLEIQTNFYNTRLTTEKIVNVEHHIDRLFVY